MKKPLIVLTVFLAQVSFGLAQVSIDREPLSFKADFINETELASIRVEAPDQDITDDQDVLADALGKPPRYAVHIPLNLSMENSGAWMDLKGDARVWRLRIESEGALATTLMYDDFNLPEGSLLHIYNDDRTSV